MTSALDDIERADKISARAHAIWEQEGRPEGKQLDHWRRAKRLTLAEELRAMAAAMDAGPMRCSTVKAYFDKVIVSGKIREDLEPEQKEAVQHLVVAEQTGVLEIILSREAWLEQEPIRHQLAASARRALNGARIPPVEDSHCLLRIERRRDPRGGLVARPLPMQLVDAPLFVALANAGLEPADARRLMCAVANSCNRFVTPDPGFDNNTVAEALCRGLVIVKPSELAAEILSAHSSH